MKLHQLVFSSVEHEHRILTLAEGIEPIMSWYGAFYVGDDYSVYINGKRVPIDHNGNIRKGKLGDYLDE